MRWHYEVRDLASLPPVRDLEGPPYMIRPAWLRRAWPDPSLVSIERP